MPLWKKILAVLIGLSLIAAGLLVVFYTYYSDLSILYSWNHWLEGTENGQLLLLGSQLIVIIVGFIILAYGLFSTNNAKQLVIFQDHTNKLVIDRLAVERNLRLILSQEYELANIDVKIHLLRNKKAAIVRITGKLISTTDIDILEKDIAATIQTNLKQILNIDLKHLTLKLTPYHDGDKVTVI
ncbi:alkaline shock response membrane anchor protein AmaP [Liquorilactobacillus capillatus]|uniref:Alkaline shock response membrane anchor protein AmaP n=1 Tax=Liquorilactobacillus capillatus DSM 19910 TaxID=1423731 RepID=A0A0R1M003_9LACO|nr:alkaline shock response membrane anchor protein AmaP [Liquorilactobacillus capillatus]KRL01279.1 hypothetical protein FC81_GL001421 [Liquorilactobacillus capillatus DSM 19910]